MPYARKESVGITISSTASEVTYLPSSGDNLSGRIHHIIYHAGTVPFTSNADVLVTIESTSQIVLQTVNLSTGSQTFSPRTNICSTTGGTTATGQDHFVIANDRLKINVTDATTSNTGTFTVVLI